MKFTLTYEGSLPSSGNKAKNLAKWKIRQELHPQFSDLWTSHPALRFVSDNRHFPKVGGAPLVQVHHRHPGPIAPLLVDDSVPDAGREILDLCESVDKHGAWFRPLVRDSYALHCGLKILFLRKEPPGKVYQGGDIDGRVKTLLDALTMPQHAEQVFVTDVGAANNKHNPIYCLLEDDSLVSGLQIESERLLGSTHNLADFVKLTIEVDVRVRQATVYNQAFLG